MKSPSTPYIFWPLNCSQKTVKSKHKIRSIHLIFCTISFLIDQFTMNRLHIYTLTNWSRDISRNFLISIHFFVVVAFPSMVNLPQDLLTVGSNVCDFWICQVKYFPIWPEWVHTLFLQLATQFFNAMKGCKERLSRVKAPLLINSSKSVVVFLFFSFIYLFLYLFIYFFCSFGAFTWKRSLSEPM